MIDGMGMDGRTRGPDPQSQAASPKSQPQMPPQMEQVREELPEGHLREQIWREENVIRDDVMKKQDQPLCTRCTGGHRIPSDGAPSGQAWRPFLGMCELPCLHVHTQAARAPQFDASLHKGTASTGDGGKGCACWSCPCQRGSTI